MATKTTAAAMFLGLMLAGLSGDVFAQTFRIETQRGALTAEAGQRHVDLTFSSGQLAATRESSQSPSEVIEIQSPRGPVNAQTSVQRYDIEFPSGTDPGDIVTVYEPVSGFVWWRFELLNSTDTRGSVKALEATYRLYITNDKLVGFRMTPPLLAIRESTQRATSLQDATSKALSDVAVKKSEILQGTAEWFRRVDLSQLGQDFFAKKNWAVTLDPARVTGVTFGGGRWEVVIEGPNRDRVIVTLDESYKVLGTRRAA